MAQKSQPPHLLLHNLLSSLSYWGTTVRILLLGFVLFVANLLTVLESTSAGSVSTYGIQFVYILGSLLLLDAGYVTIARALPISTETADRIIFLLFMIAMGLVVVLPYFAAVPNGIATSVKWVFLVSLFILSLRLVLGFFFGRRAGQR